MKKIITITLLGMFGVLALGSCTKLYTCECVLTFGDLNSTSSYVIEKKEKDAVAECKKQNVQTAEYQNACKIK